MGENCVLKFCLLYVNTPHFFIEICPCAKKVIDEFLVCILGVKGGGDDYAHHITALPQIFRPSFSPSFLSVE